MRAFTIQNFHELPTFSDINIPMVKDNHILIKLMASSLNHRDIWITKGMYPNIRLGAVMGADGCGISDGREYIINPGLDWGSSESCQSSAFRVLGVPDDGTFADYVSIERKYILPKPAHLSSAQAAALPLAGVTAFRALIKRAQLKKGEKVLVSGIGGGVALFALQFALAMECEVYVTSGSDLKIAEAISLGAKAGYIYHDPDWPKKLMSDAGGVNVIIDGACGQGFNQLLKVCLPGARISFYGGTAGKIDGLNPQLVFWRQISILGTTMGSDADFIEMIDFVSSHKIVPVIDTILPFEDIPDGFRKLESGAQFGKIVFQH